MEAQEHLSKALADRYRIERKIGSGGLTTVFLSEDLKHRRQVAIKVLDPRLAEALGSERFHREIELAASLTHPNILPVFDSGEAAGFLYYVMPYVKGESLQDRLDRETQLPVEDALQITREIADALAYAHGEGVVHRDIKPANILLEAGHAVIADFGIAKAMGTASDQDLTTTGLTVGTPAYLSPEQAVGDRVDGRSDVYALACLTYELLSGQPPFTAPNVQVLIQQHVSAPPPNVSSVRPSVDPRIASALQRAMAKAPADRFSTAGEFVEALGVGKGSGAEGIALPPILRKWWPLTLAAAVLLAVLVGQVVELAVRRVLPAPAAALAFEERDWILLTDFENLTGEEVFHGSLNTALTVSIQQSPYVNVFPRSRVQEVLRRMRREGAEPLDVELGSEIALREGIKGLLACSISKVGDAYLLAAQILDPNTQASVYTRTAQAAGRDQVLDALNELALGVRENLGESLGSIAETSLALPAATTSSLEALKALWEGRQNPGTTRGDLYRQAVELDPEFALAHADLGMEYYIQNDPEMGEFHFNKALSLMDRLTVRERLWIRAVVEDWRGNRERGIENYQTYVAQYPDDTRAWFRLGYASMVAGRISQAIDAFQRTLDLDSENYSSLVNIASCHNINQEDEEALDYYGRAFALRPDEITGIYVNHEYGNLLIRMGELEKAEETFRVMTGVDDPAKKAMGYRSLGLLRAYLGKYSEAIGHFNEAARISANAGQGLSEMRNLLYLANAHLRKGQMSLFETEMARVREISRTIRAGSYWTLVIGRLLAREGRVSEAQEVLAEMEERLGDPLNADGVNRWQRGDQAEHFALQGEIELARGSFEEAVQLFENAKSILDDRFSEPLALSLLGNGDTERSLEYFLDHLSNFRTGSETQDYWILAHYRIGEIYEQLGDTPKAIEFYQKFETIWKDGDPDLAPLVQVRRKLAELRGGGD